MTHHHRQDSTSSTIPVVAARQHSVVSSLKSEKKSEIFPKKKTGIWKKVRNALMGKNNDESPYKDHSKYGYGKESDKFRRKSRISLEAIQENKSSNDSSSNESLNDNSRPNDSLTSSESSTGSESESDSSSNLDSSLPTSSLSLLTIVPNEKNKIKKVLTRTIGTQTETRIDRNKTRSINIPLSRKNSQPLTRASSLHNPSRSYCPNTTGGSRSRYKSTNSTSGTLPKQSIQKSRDYSPIYVRIRPSY